MARKFEEYEKEVIKCIKSEKLHTIEQIFTFYTGIGKTQFYEIGLNKSNSILKELKDNIVRKKHRRINAWETSDNATLQIAWYKTVCTDEERMRLSTSNVDHTTKGDKIGTPDLSKLSVEDIEKLLNKDKD